MGAKPAKLPDFEFTVHVSKEAARTIYKPDNVMVLDAVCVLFWAKNSKVPFVRRSARSAAFYFLTPFLADSVYYAPAGTDDAGDASAGADRTTRFRVPYPREKLKTLCGLIAPTLPVQTLSRPERLAIAHTLTGIKWRCQQLMGLTIPTDPGMEIAGLDSGEQLNMRPY
jgi:hypothetical protein